MGPRRLLFARRGQGKRRSATASLRTPDRRVAVLAGRQDGLVTLDQLREAGLTEPAVRRRVSAGRLHRRHRGVYAVGHTALTPRAMLRAALMAVGPGAVLSHVSAAVVWGLLPFDELVHVSVATGRGRRQPGLAIHGARLGPGQRTIRHGLAVTSWARTLLDCAAILSVDDVVRLIDRSQALRVGSTEALLGILAEGRGHHGCKTLRAAIMVARPQDLLTRSALERRALRLLRAAGLPRPEVNARVLRYEVDLVWRGPRLVVELDGRAWHETATAFEEDRRRDATLAANGWTVLRFTWRQVVNEPRWVVETIAATLDVRSRTVA